MRELIGEHPKRLFRTCGYCGRPCVGPACAAHRDLLALDPHYQLKLNAQQRSVPNEDAA